MNKKLIILLVIAVSLVLVGQQVFAEEPQAVAPQWGVTGQRVAGGCFGGPGAGMGYGFIAQVADVIKADVNDVLAKVQAGKSLNEVAEEKGVKTEALKKELLANHKELLLQAKAAGTITQEQVDWMQARMESNIDWKLSQKFTNGGFGRGCGSGGCGGGGCFRGGNLPQTTVQSNA